MNRRVNHKLNAVISLIGTLLVLICFGVYLYAEKGYSASSAVASALTLFGLMLGAGLLGLVLLFLITIATRLLRRRSAYSDALRQNWLKRRRY